MTGICDYNEIRRDPILGRWIIIDTNRPRLPDTIDRGMQPLEDNGPATCPFCPGNEHMTPPEIASYKTNGGSQKDWRVRVFPSKHPVLKIEGDPRRSAAGMYDMLRGMGAHEVIVETQNHGAELHELDESQIETVLWAYRDRIQDLYKDERLHYALIFKNKGYSSGATIPHAHSQLIATPIIPRTVRQELEGARQYFNFNVRERCVWCDMIKSEIDFARRVVVKTDHMIAFCPYASRFPFETWILPRRHSHDYTRLGKDEALDLAKVMKMVLGRIEEALDSPSYNFVLHSTPNLFKHPGHWTTISGDFHWHFEVMPRIARVKGFEWGSGIYVNPTPPEMASDILRGGREP